VFKAMLDLLSAKGVLYNLNRLMLVGMLSSELVMGCY
jgi:hypothetical protein